MRRYVKLGVLTISGAAVLAIASGALLSHGEPSPLGSSLTSWRPSFFTPRSFVPVAAENSPSLPNSPTASKRALDRETLRPAAGAALEILIESQGGSSFPILVPSGFADTPESIAASRLRLRLLDDGYYAVFQSETMEITIIGTQIVWADGDVLAEGVRNSYVMAFEDPGPIPAGGAITFGHLGADYSVSFDCVDTTPGQRRNCTSEEAALDFVANLVAGTPTALRLPALVSS